MNQNYRGKASTKRLVQLSMLSAIIAILTFTPLGFIPLPPIWATVVHIPVIIGAVVLGPVAGGILGLVFGVCSMLKAISLGDAIQIEAFVKNPQVAIIPRILIGIVSAYVYRFLRKNKPFSAIGAAVSAFFGTLTNTVFVLGGIYIFTPQYFAVVTLVTVFTFLAEATAAIVVTVPVSSARSKMNN